MYKCVKMISYTIIALCYTETIMAHQKVLVTLIVCIGIITSVFLVSKSKFNAPAVPTNPQKADVLSNIDTIPNNDSDGDGLKDWEESLIGTNPQNKDSDSDGTSDGDEIDQGRDPKKTGPDDKNTHQNATTDTLSANISGDVTLTEQASKEFFSRYVAAKQQNVTITQEEAALIAKSVIENTYTTPTVKIYTKNDISVITDSSELAKKTYAQALATAINKNSPKNTQHELTIFATALQSQKEVDIVKLDLIIQGYKGIINDTLKIKVPQDALAYHLMYLNSLSTIVDDLSYMRLIISDPIKAYAGFSNYQKDVLRLKISFENLNTYFTQ